MCPLTRESRLGVGGELGRGGDADVFSTGGGEHAAAAGAGQEAELEQEGLDDVFKRSGILAHGGGDGLDAAGAALVGGADDAEVLAIKLIEAERVDTFHGERLLDDVDVQFAGGLDLRVVADAAEQAVGDAGRAAGAIGDELEGGQIGVGHAQHVGGAADDGQELVGRVEAEVVGQDEAGAERGGWHDDWLWWSVGPSFC